MNSLDYPRIGPRTYDADYGGIELDVAKAAELGGFANEVLGLGDLKLLRDLGEIHFRSRNRTRSDLEKP